MAFTSLPASKPKMVVATKSNTPGVDKSPPRQLAGWGNPSPFENHKTTGWELVFDTETGEADWTHPQFGDKSFDFSVEWSVDDPTESGETCAVTSGDPS
jgi:hypothetical protein